MRSSGSAVEGDAPSAGGKPQPTLGPGNSAISKLSPREREVIALMATGKTNKAIALSLGVTTGTIRGYVESILAKLDAANRAQAAAIWTASPPMPPSSDRGQRAGLP